MRGLNKYVKNGVLVLQYDPELTEGDREAKDSIICSVRPPIIELGMHWVWLLYELASKPGSVGLFFLFQILVRFYVKGRLHFLSLLFNVSFMF